MKLSPSSMAVVALSLSPGLSQAESLFSDARHIAMGGAGVASANYYAAPLVNAALLSNSDMQDRFAFQASVGAEGQNQNDFLNTLDRQLDSFDHLRSLQGRQLSPDELATSLTDVRDNLVALDDGSGNLDANASLVVAVPTKVVSVAFVAKTRADAVALSVVSDDDLLYLDGQLDLIDQCRLDPDRELCSIDFVPENLASQATGVAAAVSDIGVSFSVNSELYRRAAAFGATAKFQRVDTYHYVSSASEWEDPDFGDSELLDNTNRFNMDLGMTVQLNERTTYGLAVRDLFGYTVQTRTVQDLTVNYHVKPLVTTGFAYRSNWFTGAADLDLTQHTGFTLANGSRANRGQFLRLGGEIDPWGWVQLRGGFRYDVTDYAEPAWTLGLGLSPKKKVRFDIAATYSENSSVGALAQLAVTL